MRSREEMDRELIALKNEDLPYTALATAVEQRDEALEEVERLTKSPQNEQESA